jgi:CRISPR-associated protein Cas6
MAMSEMVDVVFDISGESVPVNYPFALWSELVRFVPELESESSVGVLPLRTTGSDCGMLLPKRAKLVVRLPRSLAGKMASLSGQELDLGGSSLKIGNAKLREIQPHSTIHAHLVAGNTDEVVFVENVSARLADLGITASLICGRQSSLLDGEQCIQGFSLVIHDLKPEDSLRLQYNGLGGDRKFGCGIFVPYKAISDLN